MAKYGLECCTVARSIRVSIYFPYLALRTETDCWGVEVLNLLSKRVQRFVISLSDRIITHESVICSSQYSRISSIYP